MQSAQTDMASPAQLPPGTKSIIMNARRSTSSTSRGNAAAPSRSSAPVTPLVWVVIWASMTVGWMLSFHGGVTAAVWWVEPFRDVFLPKLPFDRRPGVVAAADGAKHTTASSPEQLPVTSLRQAEWVVASLVLGCFNMGKVLCLPAAALVARGYGRPACLLVGVLVFAFGILLGCLSWSIAQVLLGIAVPGMGSAFVHTAVLLSDAEVAPSAVRGMMATAPMLAATSAYGVPFLMLIVPALRGAAWGWRVVWAMALLPAAALLAVWRFLPESPVSLVQRGRLAHAREALRSIRGPWYAQNALEQELCDMQAATDPGLLCAEVAAARGDGGRGLRRGCDCCCCGGKAWVLAVQARELQLLLCSRRHRPMLLVIGVLVVLQELVSNNFAMMLSSRWTVSPAYYGTTGAFERLVYEYALLSAFRVAGTAVAVALIDVVGRRWLVVGGGAASAAAMAVIAAMRHTPKHGGDDTPQIVAWGCWSMAGSFTYAPIMLLRTEPFALEVRSTAVALCLMLEHLAQACTGLWAIQAGAVSRLHWLVPCALVGSCLEALIAAFLLPESKGVPLERASSVWHTHWLWRRWFAQGGSGGATST